MQNPSDEEVLSYIDSVPGLREQWGIPGSKRLATIAFAVMNLMLLAIIIGVFVYFAVVDMATATNQVSGLIIVLILAYVVSAVRIAQLRAERRDLVKFRPHLAKHLTGNPQTDEEEQIEAEQSFEWTSNRYTYIARMIGIAALIILAINTYQVGTGDFARTLLFDGAILSYLAGAFWNNFAFKAELLEVELQERSRSTIRWQTEHPGAAL